MKNLLMSLSALIFLASQAQASPVAPNCFQNLEKPGAFAIGARDIQVVLPELEARKFVVTTVLDRLNIAFIKSNARKAAHKREALLFLQELLDSRRLDFVECHVRRGGR